MEGDTENKSVSADEVAAVAGVGFPLLSTVVGVFITVLVVGPSSAHDDNHYNQ